MSQSEGLIGLPLRARMHRRGEEMTTIIIYESDGEDIPSETEAYYEAVACQEEIYLEETEENCD